MPVLFQSTITSVYKESIDTPPGIQYFHPRSTISLAEVLRPAKLPFSFVFSCAHQTKAHRPPSLHFSASKEKVI